MQLIAGRTGQSFNRRKGRRGAFWEDRYHATAVDSEGYLARCVVYIDLNMASALARRSPGLLVKMSPPGAMNDREADVRVERTAG